jgi:hypothetical protein
MGELLGFLLDANQHGYAAGRAARQRREADHSTTIAYEAREWTFHDNYFGGEPYGGRSVVFRQGKPVWMAVYYGRVDGPPAEVQPVYSFLQRALLRAPEHLPVRGPAEFCEGTFAYRNVHHGDVLGFRGEETIHHGEEHVYTAWYSGGLVDRRPGD